MIDSRVLLQFRHWSSRSQKCHWASDAKLLSLNSVLKARMCVSNASISICVTSICWYRNFRQKRANLLERSLWNATEVNREVVNRERVRDEMDTFEERDTNEVDTSYNRKRVYIFLERHLSVSEYEAAVLKKDTYEQDYFPRRADRPQTDPFICINQKYVYTTISTAIK